MLGDEAKTDVDDRSSSMIEKLTRTSQSVLGFNVSGKLSDEDFRKEFLPQLAVAAEQGEIGILIRFANDFAGWDLPALWDEISYHTKYAFNIKRMALVGDAKWQEWLAKHSDEKIKPPAMGNAAKGYSPLDDAPGTYIFVK